MRKSNRDKILAAARSLFLQYGYNGVSVRKISEKAGLTTGAVYFHFKSKGDIYRSICLEAGDLLIERFRRGVASGRTPNQKLIAIYDSFLKFFYEYQDYYKILMEYKADYRTEEDLRSDEIITKMTEITQEMVEPIRLGIEKGVFREIDIPMLSIFLAAISEGMLQYKRLGLLDRMGISDTEFRGFMADVVGNGIAGKAN